MELYSDHIMLEKGLDDDEDDCRNNQSIYIDALTIKEIVIQVIQLWKSCVPVVVVATEIFIIRQICATFNCHKCFLTSMYTSQF